MNLALTVVLLFIALAWLFQSLRAWIGMTRLPRLAEVDVKQLESCPKVSLLFAARDEAECLPRALKTFQSQEYGNLEIIAVDDRSPYGRISHRIDAGCHSSTLSDSHQYRAIWLERTLNRLPTLRGTDRMASTRWR